MNKALAPKLLRLLQLCFIMFALCGGSLAHAGEGLYPLEVAPAALQAQLKEHIIFKDEGANYVGHLLLPKDVPISQSTWIYVKTALDYYKELKPSFIILELNTPGGEVFAAQQISDALKEMDTQHHIPVVAFVNNWAISAGAMLAYSCRFIAIAKDASMGAAEPVTFSQEGEMKEAPEKINSAMRTDFANRANFFERDPLIAEAMVDKDVLLVLRHGKIVKLDNDSQLNLTGPNPDRVINPKGKLLTLTAELMKELGVADILLDPQSLALISPEEERTGRWPASKELLFTEPFFEAIPNAIVDSYQMTWREHFFAILATPAIASLLFLGLIIGFYLEFNHPGFGLPGTGALICLFLIVLSSFSLEAVNWLEIALLGLGIVLIAIELFVFPGFGIPGVIGILFALIGLMGMLLPAISLVTFDVDTGNMNAAGEAVLQRLAWLCGTIIVAMLIIAFLAKFIMPKATLFNRLVLNGSEESSQGYTVGFEHQAPRPAARACGEAVTTMRPAGTVLLNGIPYDALSQGDFIEKGSSIVVVEVEGNKIIVDKVETKKTASKKTK